MKNKNYYYGNNNINNPNNHMQNGLRPSHSNYHTYPMPSLPPPIYQQRSYQISRPPPNTSSPPDYNYNMYNDQVTPPSSINDNPIPSQVNQQPIQSNYNYWQGYNMNQNYQYSQYPYMKNQLSSQTPQQSMSQSSDSLPIHSSPYRMPSVQSMQNKNLRTNKPPLHYSQQQPVPLPSQEMYQPTYNKQPNQQKVKSNKAPLNFNQPKKQPKPYVE